MTAQEFIKKMTSQEFHVYYGCYMHGIRIGLDENEINNCFFQWVNSLKINSLIVLNTWHFKSLYLDALNNYKKRVKK